VSEQTINLPQKRTILQLPVVQGLLSYVLAAIMALIVSGIFIAAMGYDVGQAYITILTTSFRTTNGIVQTLLKFIPLTLLALAFIIPYTAGKFNIGGEGQFLMGAIGATAAGILLADWPIWILLPVVILCGFVFGLLWGFIPGFLLYRFGIHEILSTVLLNFVAFLLVDYTATAIWNDPTSGHPMTPTIGAGGYIPLLVKNPPLNSGLIFMLLVAAAVYIYISRTSAGYKLIATGSNQRASRVFGINVSVMAVLALTLGAGLAGLAGGIEVAGVQHRLIADMQSNYKILGLIIGLIARGSPLGVPFIALFISILEVGASAMQRTMMIPVEMVYIIESFVLIFVLLSDAIKWKKS
jgi:simple sugar transport system permease protein